MKFAGFPISLLTLVLFCAIGFAPVHAQNGPARDIHTVTAPDAPVKTNPAPDSSDPLADFNPATNPKYDKKDQDRFKAARTLEDKETTDKVQEAYQKINKDYSQSDPRVAADALLCDALYAASDRYGAIEIKKKRQELQNPTGTPEEIKSLEAQLRNEGDQRAHADVRQLMKDYPSSDAAKRVQQPNWQGKTMEQWLEDRIDARNSSTLSYKVMDYLVGITGRKPAFSYWLALVLLAVIVRIITFPITLRMYKSQREMQRIQPILKEINDKYKGKPEYQEKIMECYREHNVSPFASCVPLLIQLPFMWWVYSAVRQYEFHFSHGTFLWIGSSLSHQFPTYLATNLAQFDMILLLIYCGSNYVTMKLTPPSDPAQAQQQQTMSIMMTGIMFYIFWSSRWSAAFIFYWLMTNLISAYQQYKYIYVPNKNKLAAAGAGGPTITLTGGDKNGNGKDATYETPEDRPARPESPTPSTPIPGGNAPRNRPKGKRRR